MRISCQLRAAVALLALHYVTIVLAHGFLSLPKSRNYLHNSDYCPHCLNAGGPALVSEAGERWPNGKYGICGDHKDGPFKHEAGGQFATGVVTATYVEGQVVQFDAVITAFHKGRFQFRICKIDGLDAASEKQQLTETCLDAHKLVQASVPGAQNPGDLYFHLGQENAGTPCPGCLVQGTIHTAFYQLPSGLNCDGVTSKCVLQWYWVTGNNCNPPGEPAIWANPSTLDCGEGWTPYPEEFWNCADILILPVGSAGSMLSPPPPPPPPSPPAAPVPSPSMPSGTPPCKPGQGRCFCNWIGRDGFWPEPATNCKRYYMCSQGKSFYKTCPGRLLFNSHNMACDLKRHTVCEPLSFTASPSPTPTPSPKPGTSPSTPSPSPPPPPQNGDCAFADAKCFCSTKAVDGIYPDTAYGCHGFFKCTAAVSQYIPCAKGTLYSVELQMCDWDYNVQCPRVTQRASLRVPVTVVAKGVTDMRVAVQWAPELTERVQ